MAINVQQTRAEELESPDPGGTVPSIKIRNPLPLVVITSIAP